MSGFLDRARIVAGPGFDRWLVPPAALAIHLSIGMAYGFSVFWLPLGKVIGGAEPAVCGPEVGFLGQLVTTACDWPISMLGWMYTLFFVFLGSSAAVFGGWLERVGPRKAGVVAAVCWGGGFLVSAVGVHFHQLWLMWLGSGVIGGCGLGLGYISPVSTLIKWFPDRRGMATGMAIMGFGGGAMIGSPLADRLMRTFADAGGDGVFETFLVLGVLYFTAMMAGALSYRIPAADWKPEGWSPPAPSANALVARGHVHVRKVGHTPQFWLLWAVLCLNVSAGIGVIGVASPMIQEVFGGALIGKAGQALAELSAEDKVEVATIGASFTALLSFFNIIGRFFWASLSDRLGRKVTYAVFFLLGTVLYASAPSAGRSGSVALFAGTFCVILTMYGGGFATIPAYLADLFGTQFVGAIHGRLLTAWSTAGILGPVLINSMREYQLAAGIPNAEAYNSTLYALSGLLVVGFFANLAVRPVAERYAMTVAELAEVRGATASLAAAASTGQSSVPTPRATVVVAWALVGLPMAWGVFVTFERAAPLFR